MLFTPKKEGRYDHGELNRRLTHDKMEDVFLINEVNAFSNYDSRSDYKTINLLSPCNAKYQAEASQADPLMHPCKEINASMYSITIVLQGDHHGRAVGLLHKQTISRVRSITLEDDEKDSASNSRVKRARNKETDKEGY